MSENIPVIRMLTKHDFLKLIGAISNITGKVSYLKYKKLISDDEIIKMGFDLKYFRNSKIFTYQDCLKIQSYYKFSKEELENIKE